MADTHTRIETGDRVRDRMTGFEGVAIATTDWLYNCRRITVQPTELHEGKPQDAVTFDEPQVELVQRAAFQTHVETAPAPADKTGGPRDAPTRSSDPTR